MLFFRKNSNVLMEKNYDVKIIIIFTIISIKSRSSSIK